MLEYVGHIVTNYPGFVVIGCTMLFVAGAVVRNNPPRWEGLTRPKPWSDKD